MIRRGKLPLVLSLVVSAVVATAAVVEAKPSTCHRRIVNSFVRLKGAQLRMVARCVDRQNIGRIEGPCPDPVTAARLAKTEENVVKNIARGCTMEDLEALGFGTDCMLEPASGGIQAQCAALPVTNPTEFAQCLSCWKTAQFSEFLAVLYASHAVELCGGALDDSSPVCSPLACSSPLPQQHDLGDTGEEDCQRGIARAGIQYVLRRERTLDRCALSGRDRDDCLADPQILKQLGNAETAKERVIERSCGNRGPEPDPPFCCRTGMANQCSAAATRQECIDGGGEVQEGKTCNEIDNKCDPVQGPNQKITWWGICPNSSSCSGDTLTTRQDLVACVDSAADEIIDNLLCLQFPSGWPCPPPGSPSGAFLDGPLTF